MRVIDLPIAFLEYCQVAELSEADEGNGNWDGSGGGTE